ncbi:MAG: hypothetical protein IJX41_09265 [Bacteroidaceae bacterium]|nr:hypothetical protein [Bacteroidaceae bacterium]
MKQFNKISDEELAAYLDDMLAKEGRTKVEAAMDIDTLEVLSVSRKAAEDMPANNIIELPSWNSHLMINDEIACSPAAMAGFLGDCFANEEEERENDEEE